jgi:hypothetical protein
MTEGPFEIFSQRYERASTLVTSNLPFDEWTAIQNWFAEFRDRQQRGRPVGPTGLRSLERCVPHQVGSILLRRPPWFNGDTFEHLPCPIKSILG